MEVQRTIEKPGELRGIGLHTGEEIRITLKPAPPDTGIVFKVRKHDSEWQSIKAEIGNLVNVSQSTTLGSDGIILNTVEHLMAAFWGLKIDNIYVEVEGKELPILDGSCQYFVKYLRELGFLPQPALRPYIKIEKEILIGNKDRYITATPSDRLCIDYEIEFDHPSIKKQRFVLNSDLKAFFTDIAPARTFGFLKEIKMLRKKGFLKGGSLENAIVIGRKRILNEELRFNDEFVRHKILDALGDLYLIGHPLIGHITIHKGGHSLHAEFVKFLLANPDYWSLVYESGDHLVNTASQKELFPFSVEHTDETSQPEIMPYWSVKN